MLIGLTAYPASAATLSAVKVTVEGKALEMDVPPAIVDGRTLVGVRFVGEAVGGKVDWDPVQKQATITRLSDKVVLTLGKKEVVVNGQPQVIDVAPQLISGRTMVPLRFIAEALGGAAEWDPATRTANILRKPTFITGLTYSRDVGKARVTLTLSEPLSSVQPAVSANALTLSLYPAVIKTEQSGLLAFDSLLKTVELQPDGRTVRLTAALWNAPVYRQSLSADGTQLTVEFDYTILAIQSQNDGRIPVVNLAANGKLNYNAFALAGPDRLVIDIAGGHLAPDVLASTPAAVGPVTQIRSTASTVTPDTIRVVLDLSRAHSWEILSTELGMQIRFIPQLETVKAEKLAGKTRVTVAASLPVEARVSALPGGKQILIEVPQGRSLQTGQVVTVGDGTIDSITVGPGSTRDATLFTIALPYYLGHAVVSKDGDTSVVVDVITSPVYGKRIFVDAGHGKIPGGADDPGAIGLTYKIKEKDINLAVALELERKLKAAGATVFMTRTGNEGVNFTDRPKLVNDLKPPVDMFISIHHNSTSTTSTRGTETYYWTTNPKSKTVAEFLHPAIVKALGFPDRRIRLESFVVIKQTLAPAVLLELGYMSNAAEEKAIAQPGVPVKTYPSKAADGILNGIFDYFRQEVRLVVAN